jgi:hypothetical protein
LLCSPPPTFSFSDLSLPILGRLLLFSPQNT